MLQNVFAKFIGTSHNRYCHNKNILNGAVKLFLVIGHPSLVCTLLAVMERIENCWTKIMHNVQEIGTLRNTIDNLKDVDCNDDIVASLDAKIDNLEKKSDRLGIMVASMGVLELERKLRVVQCILYAVLAFLGVIGLITLGINVKITKSLDSDMPAPVVLTPLSTSEQASNARSVLEIITVTYIIVTMLYFAIKFDAWLLRKCDKLTLLDDDTHLVNVQANAAKDLVCDDQKTNKAEESKNESTKLESDPLAPLTPSKTQVTVQ